MLPCPCGIPTVIGAVKEISPTNVICFPFVRYDWNLTVSPERPTDLIL